MEEHINNNTSSDNTENKVTEIESALHQIVSSLQSAAGAYMTLASCIHDLEPSEIPQIISQIPPPPVNISVPMQKALAADTKDRIVNYLIHGEYELTKTSWSKLQKKYGVTRGRIYSALKGKKMPEGSQYQLQRKHARKLETATSSNNSEIN